MTRDPQIPQSDDEGFDLAGLEKACQSFPPLRQFLLDLESIEESEDSRADLDDIVYAVLQFLRDIPLRDKNGALKDLALRRIMDLMFALHDLNEGKNPPLLERSAKTQNRNTKTGEGLGYDLIISAVRYVRIKSQRSEKDAADVVARELRSRGLTWADAGKVYNIVRTHGNEATRKRRVDVRSQAIDSEEDYSLILNRVAQLLRHRKE
jgi:hypothetical protein